MAATKSKNTRLASAALAYGQVGAKRGAGLNKNPKSGHVCSQVRLNVSNRALVSGSRTSAVVLTKAAMRNLAGKSPEFVLGAFDPNGEPAGYWKLVRVEPGQHGEVKALRQLTAAELCDEEDATLFNAVGRGSRKASAGKKR